MTEDLRSIYMTDAKSTALIQQLQAENAKLKEHNENFTKALDLCATQRDKAWEDKHRLKEEKATLERLVGELRKCFEAISKDYHADTCSYILTEREDMPCKCDCHVSVANKALSLTPAHLQQQREVKVCEKQENSDHIPQPGKKVCEEAQAGVKYFKELVENEIDSNFLCDICNVEIIDSGISTGRCEVSEEINYQLTCKVCGEVFEQDKKYVHESDTAQIIQCPDMCMPCFSKLAASKVKVQQLQAENAKLKKSLEETEYELKGVSQALNAADNDEGWDRLEQEKADLERLVKEKHEALEFILDVILVYFTHKLNKYDANRIHRELKDAAEISR